jgi:hypothetical protein
MLMNEVDELSDFVFGVEDKIDFGEGFGSAVRPVAPDGYKDCPKCQLRDSPFGLFSRYHSSKLKALRVLAKRTEQGETFDPEYRTYPESLVKNLTAEIKRARKPKSAGRKTRVSKQSLSEQLAQLAELKDAGALTAEEFKLAKQHLLKSPKPPAAGSTTRKNQKK